MTQQNSFPIPSNNGSLLRHNFIGPALDGVGFSSMSKHFNFIHGHSLCPNGKSKRTPTYNSWRAMMTRCYDPGHEHFFYYGGRGIEVCPRWHTFTNFLEDMGEAPDNCWLDRKDCNEPYEPGNCRWLPRYQSNSNKRNSQFVICFGARMNVAMAADSLGFGRRTLAAWCSRNPDFPGDVSQLYFESWGTRKKLTWNNAGF